MVNRAHQLVSTTQVQTYLDWNEDMKRLQEGSGNVDNQGNFSIQVLNAGLQNQYQLTLTSIKHENLSTRKYILCCCSAVFSVFQPMCAPVCNGV